MQRRVAAVYFVFFLVMGAGAYSVISVAEAPTVDIQGETYSQGDTFTVNGEQYTVSKLGTQSSSGHAGTTVSFVGQLTFTNESFQATTQLPNGSNVTFRNGTYQVQIPNESNVSQFTLRQQFNVSQRLKQDPNVENQTLSGNGTTYVRFENGTTVPLDEYLPAPNTFRFSTGDTFPYQGNQTTVASVTPSAVTLTQIVPTEQTIELFEGGNVTLGGEQFFAHFEKRGGNVQVVLAPTDATFQAYSNEIASIEYFHERIAGLWAIIILSGIAAVVVGALAYMPVKG